MDYINNVNKLIKNYMLTFILNALVFIIALSLGINTSGLLVLSILIAVVSISAYNLFEKSNNLKNLAFHIVTIAISFSISAVYRHFSYSIDVFNNSDITISITSIVILLMIVEVLYFIIKLLINRFSLYKMAIIISLIFSSLLVFTVYYISKNYNESFSPVFLLTVFYSVIFFSSIVSILFLKKSEKFQFVLMVSHFFIFSIVFIIALSIITEDGSFLEFFVPDAEFGKRKK